MPSLRLDNRGLQKLANSSQMRVGVLVHARRLQAIAESISPVGTPPDDVHPGLYRRSWRTVQSRWRMLSRYGPHHRVQVTVRNDAPYAAAIEFGNSRIVARHTLQRAVDMARLS